MPPPTAKGNGRREDLPVSWLPITIGINSQERLQISQKLLEIVQI